MSYRIPHGLILLLAAACRLPALSHADEPGRSTEEFGKLDINQDGRLSGTEISTELRPFDADRDGRVTRDEYLAATAKPSKQTAEKQFQERDINQDGVLSGIEQRGVENADADSDGEVSKQEFLGKSSAAGPSRQALYAKAQELFTELDVTKDYRLSGTELKTVAGYDLDSDGRMNLDEFFEGYERAQGAGWTTVNFPEGRFQAKLPATPERLKVADPMKVHAAVEIEQPDVRFEVRLSEVGSDVEAKADLFFTAVKDRLKTALQMEIIDEDDAPYNGHPGRVLFFKGTQDDFHALRIVLVKKSIYELEAIFNKKPADLEKSYTRRFLEQLSIEFRSSSPDDDVPAPPSLLSSPRLRGLPGRSALTDPAVPPAPTTEPAVPPAPFGNPVVPPAPATEPAVPPAPFSNPVVPPAPKTDSGPVAPPSLPTSPSLSEGPLSPRRGRLSLLQTRSSQNDDTANQAAPKQASQATPPNGKYVLQKIGGGMLLGLGTLEVRNGTYRWGDEGEFAPFTVDAQGNIVWSAGLKFLPDGWTHEFSKYAGLDSSGRPMLKIHYHSKSGAKDIIDGIIE